MPASDSELPGAEPLRPVVYRVNDPHAPLEPFAAGPTPPHVPQLRSWKLPLVLFLCTCCSTWVAGAQLFGLREGLQYALLVMAILAAHEMGHFLQSVRYGVPASLPLFLPMPFISPLGTMGAVIFQKPGVATRKSLYDIAITGPLAGLAVTLPVLYYGILQAKTVDFPANLPPDATTIMFADPLLIKGMMRFIHGPIPPGQDFQINAWLFAGWVGVLITALNLFPLGQLDGGHILYTLLGRRSHRLARSLFRFLVALVILGGLFIDPQFFGWGLMLLLVRSTGVEHPPTANDQEPLGAFRRGLGWATLLFVILGFMPRPIYEARIRDLLPPQRVLEFEHTAEEVKV